MILLSAAGAAAAVWLFWRPPPGSPPGARQPGGTRSRRAARRGLVGVVVVMLAMLAVSVTTAAMAGPGVAVRMWAAALPIGTVALLIGRRRARRRAAEAAAQVAVAARTLAAQLRIGRVPAEALDGAAADCPVLRDAARARALGGDVARVWRTQSDRPGHGGLLALARAWEVSAESGAPMSAVLDQVAARLRDDGRLRDLVDAELAGPRATGKVMAALPLCGVGLGYLLGGDPLGWLLGTPAGSACLLAGVVLACAGLLWMEALAAGAGP